MTDLEGHPKLRLLGITKAVYLLNRRSVMMLEIVAVDYSTVWFVRVEAFCLFEEKTF